jgi:hypothetical protein
MEKDITTSIKANVNQNDEDIHKAIDVEFAEAAEKEMSDALSLIRASIILRKNNPALDRNATLELTLQACRHLFNAAEHLPPVDEEGQPYGYSRE